MTKEVKLRLYVTAIVVVMATLYITPILVASSIEDVRKALLQSCMKEFPSIGFDYCWDQSRRNAALPFWTYLLPYFPAGLALWLNWLIKPDLRLSEEAFPKRTINVLMWFGLLAAVVAIWIPFSEIASRVAADLYKIQSQIFWVSSWLAAAWLMAPILFTRLVGPVSLAPSMRKGEIGLWLLAGTPVVAFVLYAIRSSIGE